ncbi:MAG: transcriptional regulator [Crenarchaeota archaeon]|nr:transcriptional regulator [Thermoproteota archaeon]
MSKLEKAIKIAHSAYFTGLARLIMLVRLGMDRKKKLTMAGLGASTVYSNLFKAARLGLVVVKEDETIVLTSKGQKIADILIEAHDKIENVS